jgi:hypothetical protein
MDRVLRVSCLAVLAVALQAATLEYLSTDDMIGRSTAIVRARVLGTSAAQHGPLIYTHFDVQVTERFKGPEAPRMDVVVPGGAVRGLRQTFSGAPGLVEGGEYLLFLWTGPSGLTHVIGLSQGVFTLTRESGGEVTASRRAGSEAMLDARTGRTVADRPVRLRLTELRSRVAAQARQKAGSQ